MAQKINVNLPESVVVGDGWTIEWDAVDPTTGASVSGVVITQANVTATDLSEPVLAAAQQVTDPLLYVPGAVE